MLVLMIVKSGLRTQIEKHHGQQRRDSRQRLEGLNGQLSLQSSCFLSCNFVYAGPTHEHASFISTTQPCAPQLQGIDDYQSQPLEFKVTALQLY